MQDILTHFASVDPKLHQVMASRTHAFALVPTEHDAADYFPRLCRNIIAQQLAGKAADAILGRFAALFPDGQITPERVLEYPEQAYRDVGASWAKARYLRDAALHTQNGVVRYHEFDQMSDEAIITELTQIKGVGRWTAEMFLIFTLGRQDVFSFGDLGLRKAFQKLYEVTDKQLGTLMEHRTYKWSPYRSYASVVLWDYLDNR